jgi:branched-chain amino acid transport system ATP-binding protein
VSGEPPALVVERLEAGYEPGLPIVRGASIEVRRNEIVAILGPNGAGKSTLVKAVAGLVPVSAGRIMLGPDDITGTAAHRLVRMGLAFVPQSDNVFANLTVEENLDLAGFFLGRRKGPRLAAMLALFPDLERQRRLLAGRLSGGQRQMLAIARALIVEPRVLLLDEPSAGLSPRLVDLVLAKLGAIRGLGLSVLIVEQNARAALRLADRAYVLVEGRERIQGPAATLLDSPEVRELYLGGGR